MDLYSSCLHALLIYSLWKCILIFLHGTFLHRFFKICVKTVLTSPALLCCFYFFTFTYIVLICSERNHSPSQFHSLNPESLLTTACSQRYTWKERNTQMDREEKERQRGRSDTHCLCWTSWQLSHAVMLSVRISPDQYHTAQTPPTLSEIHSYNPSYASTGQLCVCARQCSTSGSSTPCYKPFASFNTLIYTFEDGNTVFMDCCCSDACYGLNIFLVPALKWNLQSLGVKCNDSSRWRRELLKPLWVGESWELFECSPV